jgi:hypothetical protein
MGRCDDARAAICCARSLHDTSGQANPSSLQLLVWCEAQIDMAAGQAAAALGRWKDQVADAGTAGAGEREGLRMLTQRAVIECAAGNAAAALERAESVLRALAKERRRDCNSELEAQAQRVRGEALLCMHRPADAAAALADALRLSRAIFDDQRSPFIAATLALHARALRAEHQRAAARADLTAARAISRRLRDDAAGLP